MHDSWPCLCFSLGNAQDDGPTDLPHLLRRLAAQIEAQGIRSMDILDVTIESEITEDGPWWSATVYWSPDRSSVEP